MGNRLTRDTDRPGGWTVLFNDFIDSVGKVTANEKLILLILFRYGDKVFPSLQTLANSSGLSKSTVQRVIYGLEEKEIIRIVHRKGNGKSLTSNEYIVSDYHEMWVNDEILNTDETSVRREEIRAIQLLKARGYAISKPKELPTAPTTVTEESPQPVDDNNTGNKKMQQKMLHARNMPFEEIKNYYDYEALAIDFKDQTEYLELLDTVMNILYDLLNTSKTTIRVNKEDKPKDVVVSRLRKLQMCHVRHVIETYTHIKEPIPHGRAYITTLLYNAIDDYNHWIAEMYKENNYG